MKNYYMVSLDGEARMRFQGFTPYEIESVKSSLGGGWRFCGWFEWFMFPFFRWL